MEPPRYQAANDHLMQIAEADGLQMSRPEIRANSHLAMMADAFARDAGMQEPFHTNMLNAYWQEHRNIGLREVVLDVAAKSGLDAADLEKAFDEGRYEQELADIYDECHRYGITGVPTFLIGRYMVVGAQPYEILEKALALASQEDEPAR